MQITGATHAVDVIIAVHDPSRPLARAVRSVLTSASARVIVVAHGIDTAAVTDHLRGLPAERVLVVPFVDGIASPAGPFNAGLDVAEAEWVAVMGSDDEVEAGAIDAWHATAVRTGADVVIPMLRHARGRVVPTPPARPGRRALLDPVRDRVAYRTAPLGLLRRDVVGTARMTPGIPSGEDLAFGLRLWFSGRPIAFARNAPAYLIHDDARTRVTGTARPIASDMEALRLLREGDLFAERDESARRAIAVKVLRIHLFGAIANRSDPGMWTQDDVIALREETASWRAAAPGVERVFSVADRRLLGSMSIPGVDPVELIRRADIRRRRLDPRNIVPSSWRGLVDREGPLRFMIASLLLMR